MNDPERLLRTASSPLSLVLLRAGAEEKPSSAVRSRTARAVVAALATGAAAKSASAASIATVKLTAKGRPLAPATTAASATALSTHAKVGAGVLAKWFAIGALGGVIATPLVRTALPGEHAARARPPAPVFARAPASPSSARPSANGRSASESEVVEARGSSEPARKSPVGPARTASAEMAPDERGKPDAPPRADSMLLAEVNFVEQGRAALKQRTFARALERLAPYEAQFPHQQLLTEVLFLRMEAWSRLGDAEQAHSLAERVITRGVAGPQAARAREVLAP